MFPRPILHFVKPRTKPTPDPYILPPPSDILVHTLPSRSTAPACALVALPAFKARGWPRAPPPALHPCHTPLPAQGGCCTGADPCTAASPQLYGVCCLPTCLRNCSPCGGPIRACTASQTCTHGRSLHGPRFLPSLLRHARCVPAAAKDKPSGEAADAGRIRERAPLYSALVLGPHTRNPALPMARPVLGPSALAPRRSRAASGQAQGVQTAPHSARRPGARSQARALG
jgi:hypothetical protein